MFVGSEGRNDRTKLANGGLGLKMPALDKLPWDDKLACYSANLGWTYRRPSQAQYRMVVSTRLGNWKVGLRKEAG